MSPLYTKLVDAITNIRSISITLSGAKILAPNALRDSSLEDICELYLEMTENSCDKFKKDISMDIRACVMYASHVSRYIANHLEELHDMYQLQELWNMNIIWLNINDDARCGYNKICMDYGKKPPRPDKYISVEDIERLKRKIKGMVVGSITPLQAGILLYHNESYRPLLRDVFDVTISRKQL